MILLSDPTYNGIHVFHSLTTLFAQSIYLLLLTTKSGVRAVLDHPSHQGGLPLKSQVGALLKGGSPLAPLPPKPSPDRKSVV